MNARRPNRAGFRADSVSISQMDPTSLRNGVLAVSCPGALGRPLLAPQLWWCAAVGNQSTLVGGGDLDFAHGLPAALEANRRVRGCTRPRAGS